MLSLALAEFALGGIFEVGSLTEEGIVEGDDTSFRAVIGLQGQRLDLLGIELLLDVVEQSPVA